MWARGHRDAMTRLSIVTVTLLSLNACGSSDDDDVAVDAPAAIDAVAIDAPAGTLASVVDCTGLTPAAEVRFEGDVLSTRAVAITAGQVVRFHSLGRHTAWHDQGLWSANGDESTCVRFDGAGVYGFYCYFDSVNADERGTVTVQ